MIDDALAKHYDELAERDYNRSKAGLGSAAEVEQSRPALTGGHSEGGGGDGRAVALHYNSLADRHRTLSSGSDILHLRNLNNWIKSVLIKEHMQWGHGVLDLACGKGGDLNKFKIGGVEHYVGIDIAGQSVRDAVHRFNGSDRHPPMKFAATFCVGDFCQVDLEATLPRELRFQLVSCQFALHYSFASEESALRLLRNVACRLQPGGVFVGTTTDANVLIRRLRAAPGLSFGNQHYSVTFDAAHASKRFPASAPFGVRYRFSLQEAVDDCEEFLVHFPTLERLALQCGLKLEARHNFTDFFAASWRGNKSLLDKMRVLPEHGTISDAEWEVAHTYLAFAFRRLGPNGETVTRPPPPLSSAGATQRVTEADILWLEGGDGLTAAPAAHAAAAAAPAHAPASRKRERGPAGAESGRPAKAANAGRPPPNIHTEQDSLFD